MPLLELRDSGFYCPAGDFYIDPWSPVNRAIVTHAHPEHATPGSSAYLTATPGEALLRDGLGLDAAIEPHDYGVPVTIGDVRVSLHPAGHILGSAQIRIEHQGEVWVFSGDYQLAPDPTCTPFEPVRCHTFLTEATFGLPIFRWPAGTLDAIHGWWRSNQEAGKASLLYLHPLGMAQRVLAGIDHSIGPLHTHEIIERFDSIYRAQGVVLPPTPASAAWPRALILAPPSARGSAWVRSLGPHSDALVSGWMRIRGTRRRLSLDRGFVISDHADWPALLRVIDETQAETIIATHGFRAPLVRWLQEHGRRAMSADGRFEEAQA